MQEIIELVVFGLIALLVGTGLLWVLGWLFGIAGIVFKFVAGFIWSLLRFIVPIVIVGGLAYALVRFFQSQSKRTAAVEPVPAPPTPAPVPPAPAETADEGDGDASESDDGGDASDGGEGDGEGGDDASDDGDDRDKS